jgi:hypothetical protein
MQSLKGLLVSKKMIATRERERIHTICCVHDVVQVVHSEAAILASLTSNAGQSILALATWLFSALAGAKAG